MSRLLCATAFHPKQRAQYQLLWNPFTYQLTPHKLTVLYSNPLISRSSGYVITWLIPPRMTFDHPGLCPPGENRNQDFMKAQNNRSHFAKHGNDDIHWSSTVRFRKVVIYIPPALTRQNSAFCPHHFVMCLWFPQKATIILNITLTRRFFYWRCCVFLVRKELIFFLV
jgi:hypothetical protein